MGLLAVAFLTGIALSQNQDKPVEKTNRPLKILTRPRPTYPEEARRNHVEGTVKLMITYESDGSIGEVICINEDGVKKAKLVKYGVVAAVIEAAKKITFDPEIKDGEPITVKRGWEYTIKIY